MKFCVLQNGTDELRDRIAEEMVQEFKAHGYEQTPLSGDLNFIINLTAPDLANAVHRRAQNEFVVSVMALHDEPADLRYVCYNVLVQTLSNLVVCIRPYKHGPPEIYCTTPEVGFYHFPYTPEYLYEQMLPIIGARFMINNCISEDLPYAYRSTPVTEQLIHYGKVLDSLGVLPTPFPLDQVLSPENIEHLYALFNVKGLSYGNLSAREQVPEIGPHTFWMTARGVDKARLKGVGEDILMVKGYDMEAGEILVSLPPGYRPRIRVSVDAIEHALIYQEFPEVGAIVHVHAWTEQPIPATRQNYPCGTLDLAIEVVSIFKTLPNPERAIVGLKNHGLTITGNNLKDIFTRIDGKLLHQVPMMA
jgi:hypothetical protein